MGGFSLNLPGITPEPVTGPEGGDNTLIRYLRSVQNQGGAAISPFLNQGAGGIGTGQGTIGTGVGQLGTAFSTTQPAVDYWSKILSGDPRALTEATAPTANALSQVFSGATNNASQNTPAGGARNVMLAQLPQMQAQQVGNFLLGLQPQAATNLNQLAQTQGQIGSGTVSAGFGSGQLGIGTAGIGTNLYQQTLNALLGVRGQDVTETGQNKSLLGGILGGSGGSSNGQGGYSWSLSDIDAKTGLIPLGIVDGVHVFAWRYKETGELAMGVIAQEVQHVVPEAVSRGVDGFLRVNYDLLFRSLRMAEAA